MNVNINDSYFYYSSNTLHITGIVKNSSSDFVVREIPILADNCSTINAAIDVDDFTLPSNEIRVYTSSLTNTKDHDSIPVTVDIGSTITEEVYAIDQSILDQCCQLNDLCISILISNPDPEQSLLLHKNDTVILNTINTSSQDRSYIHNYIKLNYALLQTKQIQLPSSSSDAESRSGASKAVVVASSSSAAFDISISIDFTFIPLLRHGLSAIDIISLYKYRNYGPNHINAKAGIMIGLNVSREVRTNVYRNLVNYCRNFDSKTIDNMSGKWMLIFWRVKCIRKNNNTNSKNSFKSANNRTSQVCFVKFHMKKCNIEQMAAIDAISLKTGISCNNICIAGIKDKKAITYQQLTITIHNECFNGNEYEHHRDKRSRVDDHWYCRIYEVCQQLLSFNDPNTILIGNLSLVPKVLALGMIWGNYFSINIRNAAAPSCNNTSMIYRILEERIQVLENRGYPNYYGSQRMGGGDSRNNDNSSSSSNSGACVVLPNGVRIGKNLVSGNYKFAIELILLGGFNSVMVKQLYYDGEDLSKILKAMPSTCMRERSILKGMLRYGWPYDRCMDIDKEGDASATMKEDEMQQCDRILQQLNFSTRSLWVNAYHSWLWNSVVSHRLMTYGHLPIVGDLILREDITHLSTADAAGTDNGTTASTGVTVIDEYTLSNLNDTQKQLLMYKVVIPLFGTHIVFPLNEVGTYYRRILEEQEICLDGTHAKYACNILPKAVYRTVLQKPHNVCVSVSNAADDDVNDNIDTRSLDETSGIINVKLQLPTGSYATAFLREFLCNNNVI